jgi:catechol 2,3-dioxygenase-like lactoylglutathione lyase family enzyme
MTADTLVRFHLSLNVSDLGRSVAFFRTLFGREPAKLRPDYAKFEPDSPPLVLSLEPNRPGSGGVLNHVGVRMPDAASLVAVQRRLEEAGVRCQREEGVECCYAKQTKFWLHDPDGTLWEMYTLDGDIAHRGAGQSQEVVTLNAPMSAAVEWEHRMNQPVPDRIPLDDDTAAEVRLRGTFNLPLSADQRAAVVGEAVRVLQPGGRLFVHVLTADRAVDGPDLPGPAAAVRHVPTEGEPLRLLEAAGLTAVRLLKFDARPCFVRHGVEMRETQIEGRKPVPAAAAEPTWEVLYRGPFDQIDADGRAFPRGVRVTVPATAAARFHTPEWSAQFTVFGPSSHSLRTADACST